MEFTLLGAALLSAAAVYATLYYEEKRRVTPGRARDLWDIVLIAAVTGLFVGRLAAMALAGTNPLTHPADVVVVRSGVDTGWASVAALGALAVAGRRDPWRTADAIAPAALAGLAAWHASCVLRGACLGTPSGLPWAVAQSGSRLGRHPVEIYAALGLLAAAALLLAWTRRLRPPGTVAAIALAAAAAARLATEPLRPVLGSGPEPWYAAGVVTGLALAVWRWRAGHRGASNRHATGSG